MGVGIILLHFGSTSLWSAEVEGDGIFLLVDALTKSGASTLVTPTMGIWGGKTIIDGVVANGIVSKQSDLEDRGVDDVWDLMAIISTSKILAAGVPNKAISNCCIPSACKSSAKLCIWLARQIFCNAWSGTKSSNE